jgi:RimJ/RimL family protein N-acetyltransferase
MDHHQISSSRQFRFTFKLAEQHQKQLIHNWIAQEHIREWVHGEGLRNLLENLENFFKGTSFCQHWIAYENATPFGYLLTSNEGEAAMTLDLFICDLNYLGKGLSVQMIQEFLISQFPNKKEVLIDPEAANTRAIHVYEKVGFRIIGEFIAKWHPVLHYKMRLDMKNLIQN